MLVRRFSETAVLKQPGPDAAAYAPIGPASQGSNNFLRQRLRPSELTYCWHTSRTLLRDLTTLLDAPLRVSICGGPVIFRGFDYRKMRGPDASGDAVITA